MNYNLYIDESWDHSLDVINKDFPYFILCWILISEEENKILDEKIKNFKIKYFNNEKAILHSRDIRRCEKDFKILLNKEIKENFYNDFEKIIKESDFKIISIIVKKKDYLEKYWKTAINPYNICLSYLLERASFQIDSIVIINWELQTNIFEKINIFVEKRWKKEDKNLLNYYNYIKNNWTFYVSSYDFSLKFWKFDFRDKRKNDIWIQIADLCAYPIVKSVEEDYENPAFKLLIPKILKKNWEIFWYWIKILP